MCTAGESTTNHALVTYSAKITYAQGGNWLTINNLGGLEAGAPLSNGLNLSVNSSVAGTLATGAYSGQVMVYNPANQADLMMVNVSLLVHPGRSSISPASGSGNSQTFTLTF